MASAVTVERAMRAVNNFFDDGNDPIEGAFTIRNGCFTGEYGIPDGGYIAVSGSALNDGVHQIGTYDLQDEDFTGRVWVLHPPRSFLDLCDRIAEFDAKTPAGGFQSESFDGYSYTRAGGVNGVQTWQEAFARDLARYRAMFTGVSL